PAQAHALCTAVAVIRKADDARARLARHIAYFRRQMAHIPLQLARSTTAIQPILVGDNQRTLHVAERLRARGLWVTAIRPPTVPVGSARLRVTLSAAHEDSDIDALLEALDDLSRE
ncbi:MAG TPA: 8-amino-7-oxononanoate synthase, partial [Atlantibacter hermannii]|nr:8-amino-7-oxononanoate synthase [Atlantibacter hermannii]